MTRSRIRILLAGVTALLVTGVLFAAAMATNIGRDPLPEGTTETLSGPHVVTRNMSVEPPLEDSRMVIIQGVRAEDGTCRHRVGFQSSDGDVRPQMARLVAVDESTCRFQVEYGYPTVLPTTPTDGSVTESETHVTVEGN